VCASWILLLSVLVYGLFTCDRAYANELVKHVCAHETGTGSRAHENTIDRLSGRHLVFIGDSVSRYQYLALAYYVVTGKCADPNSAEYILSELSFSGSWETFYKRTSEMLTIENQKFRTTETCFCSRLALRPGKLVENRSFQYTDMQVRSSTNPAHLWFSAMFIGSMTQSGGCRE
jgi:hypothetical protein